MHVLLRWVVNALLFLAVAWLLPDRIHIDSFGTALIVALIWGLISITLKPILVILTLPVNILTLGLFTFVINAFLFWFVGEVVKGFTIVDFWSAFLGALLLSIFHAGANMLMKNNGHYAQ